MKEPVVATIYLGLGTNLGDRVANLQQSIDKIADEVGLVLQQSAIYQTKAWGLKDQPDFLNQVLKVSTLLSPQATLKTVLAIENAMGRIRTRKWYTRLIDIDLLFYEGLVMETPTLVVPHPYVQDRNFVLAPLVEIAPDLVHPIFKKNMMELWEECADILPIERLGGD